MKKGNILIIDDNQDILLALNLLLEPYAEQIRVSTDPERIEGFLKSFNPDVILLDMNFNRDASSGREGFLWLDRIKKADPDAVVIFITAYADMEKAVQAIKMGAADFIPKPWNKEKLLATVSAGVELRRSRVQVQELQQQLTLLSSEENNTSIIGESETMLAIFDMIDKLRDTNANILITGENGTGKDLIAHAVYKNSPRSGNIFTSIDLGSIPEQLFESELFGYEKGAFTDAKQSKSGRLEIARGGTLFLDEIGNLSLTMQAKLLTAIEKQQITRLGSTTAINTDVRIISATNANLFEMIEEGSFRQDLLYRINTIEIHIPPLRERGNDVFLLAGYFLDRFARKYNKRFTPLSREVKQRLQGYAWPGNVRELEHAIERAVILSNGTSLKPDDFMLSPQPKKKKLSLEELNLIKLEKEAIVLALKRTDGNVSQAAELLGITRFALYRKMEKSGL